MHAPSGPGGGSAARSDRRIAGYFTAAVLVTAMIAGIVAVIFTGGDSSDSTADGPFGPHHEGLEQRRLAADVPTMADGGGEHFHARLKVYARGREVAVPPNIGIDPSNPPDLMAGLHTHDASGTIHNEAGTGATLGDFFSIWGVPFSGDRLGPYEATGSDSIRLWVDGRPSKAFGDLNLADGQEIVLSYGQVPAGVLE